MNIKDLYLEYLNLKDKELSYDEIEWELCKKNIKYEEIKNDYLDSWEIEDSIIPRLRTAKNSEERREILSLKHFFKIKDDKKFIRCSYMEQSPIEKSYIKFYLQIPNNIREKFMIDYGNFVKENKVRGTYKIRNGVNSNDMLTVRVFNPKHYKKVFNFLSNYIKDKNNKHEFIPTIDGIGVTIDDGGSYNKYITDGLINYFNNCKSVEEVSNINFLKFMTDKKTIDKMNLDNTYSSFIYNINLLNSFDKKLNLEEVINLIEKSQSMIADYPFENHEIIYLNRVIKEIINSISYDGLETALKMLEEFLNNKNLNCEITTIKNTMENRLKRFGRYNSNNSINNFLKQQLIIYNNNLNNVCKLIDDTFNKDSIDGVINLLNELKKIIDSNSEKYNIKEVNIPYFSNDEFHSINDKVNNLSLSNIYRRLLKLYNLEDDNNIVLADDKIIELYKNKLQSKSLRKKGK